eukprot:7801629-Pyramimonas_sp.AAC.1
MVEFVCEEGDACVGLFTVRKKSGAQRLIADCRQSNCFFTSSDHVELPTSGALSRLRLEAGEQLYVGLYDLKDAFFQFGTPPELRRFFHLPPIKA